MKDISAELSQIEGNRIWFEKKNNINETATIDLQGDSMFVGNMMMYAGTKTSLI